MTQQPYDPNNQGYSQNQGSGGHHQPPPWNPAPPPPPHGHGYGQQQGTPGLSVAALVLGIVSFVLCGGCLTGVPAIICGHMALGRYKTEPHLPGRGMALWGLILGYVMTGISILGFIFYFILGVGSMMM